MYAVIFKAKMKEITPEYTKTAEQLRELAALAGCTDFTSVLEGEYEITISYWQTLQQIKSWKENPIHLAAQQKGKFTWYESYHVEVTEILREYRSHNN